MLRRWMRHTGASAAQALAAAAWRPARALEATPLRPGAPADLLLLRDDGAVERTLRRGRWAPAAGAG